MIEDAYFEYRKYIRPIALHDAGFVSVKDASYGGSWKRGGGRSAWFMLRRKMDRLLEMMKPPEPPEGWPERVTGADLPLLLRMTTSEDVFARIAVEPTGADGTVLAEIRDLRRYLLLVEAEMVAQGRVEVDSDSAPARSAGSGAAPPSAQGSAEPIAPTQRPPQPSRPTSVVACGVCGRTIPPNFFDRPGTPEDGGHHSRTEPRRYVLTPTEYWTLVGGQSVRALHDIPLRDVVLNTTQQRALVELRETEYEDCILLAPASV